MKNGGLRQLVSEILEEAVASSDIVTKLCTSIHAVASEAKCIAESVHIILERIEMHEKILIQLCSMAEKQTDPVDFHHHAKSKETPKPN